MVRDFFLLYRSEGRNFTTFTATVDIFLTSLIRTCRKRASPLRWVFSQTPIHSTPAPRPVPGVYVFDGAEGLLEDNSQLDVRSSRKTGGQVYLSRTATCDELCNKSRRYTIPYWFTPALLGLKHTGSSDLCSQIICVVRRLCPCTLPSNTITQCMVVALYFNVLSLMGVL